MNVNKETTVKMVWEKKRQHTDIFAFCLFFF